MVVLAVDDSKFNLAVAEKHLKEIYGISRIILSSNPADTKTLIDENNVDILILDLVMPKITGFDILSMLRNDNRYDDMPIIVFTSLDDSDSFKKCFEMGASDYINKPINDIEFKARITAAIRLKSNSNKLKKLLEIAKKQNEELKEINIKLTDTKLQLIQSENMAAIGVLAAGIAHEINNPMGFINSNFEILEKYLKRIFQYFTFVQENVLNLEEFSPQSIEIKAELEQIAKKLKINSVFTEMEDIISESKDGIRRVTEIVQSLLAFARSIKEDEKDLYNLNELISQVCIMAENEVKNIADVEILVPKDIFIYCNRGQIGQVIINMLLNSVQAIKLQDREEKGKIKILAEKAGGFSVIKISDDGPGIAKENLSKVFEPFFTTKDVGQGKGLGLSFAYDIVVNKHKGKIEVQSEEGKGAIFIISIPDK